MWQSSRWKSENLKLICDHLKKMSAAAAEQKHLPLNKTFHIKYLGNVILGRRYTPIILPWVVAEVRRKAEQRSIALEVQAQSLQGTLLEETDEEGEHEVIFSHKLQRISRFAKAKWDPACFAYLTREDVEKSPFTCHAFLANESEVSAVK